VTGSNRRPCVVSAERSNPQSAKSLDRLAKDSEVPRLWRGFEFCPLVELFPRKPSHCHRCLAATSLVDRTAHLGEAFRGLEEEGFGLSVLSFREA